MADVNLSEVNFLDVACILKITPDMTEEKFGSAINASYFDAANIVGTLKQKGLIDINSGFPGPTSISLTDSAKKLIDDINARSAEPIDALDLEILKQLASGKRLPFELQSTLNIVAKDLAYRLYKLYKQNFVNYELKNGNVELMLTEQGFLKASTLGAQGAPQAQAQAQAQTAQAPGIEAKAEEANEINEIGQALGKPKAKGKMIINIILLVIIILLILAILFAKHII